MKQFFSRFITWGLVVVLLHSCNKTNTDQLVGKWQLVSAIAEQTELNQYLETSYKMEMVFSDDTINYTSKTITGLFSEPIITNVQHQFAYNLSLEINSDLNVNVISTLTDVATNETIDTTFASAIETGEFYYSQAGGEDYTMKLIFGENNVFILGANQSNANNVLFTNDSYIGDSTIVLKYFMRNQLSNTDSEKFYNYTFQRIAD